MKFLCDNCKAKYQIPDEKVAGRTLRMQCRKCGHDILIRGTQLADSVQAARPAAAASVVPQGGSPVPRGTRTAGSHVGPLPTRPGSVGPSALAADFRRQMQAPSMAADEAAAPEEMWHVAINDVPVGPIRREELARKVGTGAVHGDSLVWREGFDDWRPLREVPQLAGLLRHLRTAPPTIGHAPIPPEPSRPMVAPIGGRLGASAAADQDFNDEATVVAQSPYQARDSRPPASPFAAPAIPERIAADLAQSVYPAARGDSLLPPAISEPPAAAPAFVAAAPRVESQPAIAAPAPAPPAAPLSAPASAPAIASPPPKEKERAPLPIGALMGIAFAGMAGLGVVLLFGMRMMAPAPAPAATPAPAPTPVAATTPAPAPELDTTIAVEEPTTAPAEPQAQATADTRGSSRPSTGSTARTGSTTPATTASSRPVSEQDRAALARFADESGSSGASAIDVGRVAPTTQVRPLDSQAISTVVSRNRLMLQRCYERAARGMAQAPTTRMDVSLRVAPSGAVSSANVSGNDFGGLAACIQSTVSRWRFPESTGGGETRFPVVFQGSN